MLNKWLRLALLALVSSLAMRAEAQYLPRPVGATRLPEPAPINSQSPPPNLIEGPLTPQLAPPGPCPDLSLSEEHSSAFQALQPECKLDYVFTVGSIFLKRQGIGTNPVAVLDNQARVVLGQTNIPIASDVSGGGNFPVPTDVFFQMVGYPDDGRNPPAGSPFFGEFSDLRTQFAAGLKLGMMVVGDSTAVEVAGFAVSKASTSTTIISPSIALNSTILLQNIPNPVVTDPNPPLNFPIGTTVTITGDPLAEVSRRILPQFSELDLPFFNAPAGFGGNNNLWRNADLVNLHFDTSLSSLEGNVRCFTTVGSPCEGILGIRVFEHRESLSYTTVDDLFQDTTNPTPLLPQSGPTFNTPSARRVGDPTVTATYSTRVRNRVIGPQFGFEGHLLPFNWLALNYGAKAMAGVNLLEREVGLMRGDGLEGFRTTEKLQRFAHAYEMTFNADISLLECAHLRAGYNLFWLLDVATAVGQIDYDLSHTAGRRNSSDSVFYYGPSVELEFVF
jgi:hypothetical protein